MNSPSQPNYDFLFPKNKQWFTIRQIALKLERDPSTIWRFVDSGQLSTLTTSSNKHAANAFGGKEESKYKYDRRIPRENLIAWLCKYSEFDSEMQQQWGFDVADCLNKEQLKMLANYCINKIDYL